MLRLLGKLLPLIIHEIVDLVKARAERKRVEKQIIERILKNQQNEDSQ